MSFQFPSTRFQSIVSHPCLLKVPMGETPHVQWGSSSGDGGGREMGQDGMMERFGARAGTAVARPRSGLKKNLSRPKVECTPIAGLAPQPYLCGVSEGASTKRPAAAAATRSFVGRERTF